MTAIEIREIVSLDKIEALRQAWTDLFDDSLQPTVFGAWEWQYLAAKHIAEPGSVRILTAYEDDNLVGVLPLASGRTKVGGIFPAATLRCLGGDITDYNALLVKRSFLPPVIRAMRDYLSRTGMIVILQNVLPGSPLDVLGRYMTRAGFYRAVYESKVALVSRLDGDHEHFMKLLTKKFQGTLRNNQNYMDRSGGYTYHVEPDSAELLDALINLHTSRWKHKGKHGALATRQVRDFHAELSQIDNKPFGIQYHTIRHEGDIAAILYGFVFRNRFMAYLSGFDMTHDRISPGNMVFHYCIRQLYDDGAAVFDMLRGDAKYKQTWATATYEMQDALYFPPSASGRLLYGATRTMQGIKRAVPVAVKRRLKSLIP